MDNFTTRRGDDIVKYVSRHWNELGCSPTIRDICRVFGIRSTSTALGVVRNLESQGKLVRDPYRRSIKAVNGSVAGLCQHDWRVRNPSSKTGTFIVQCSHCLRVTEVESKHDPKDPTTWLQFRGEVG
jgi:SOS-response transcriptional repressor LexA